MDSDDDKDNKDTVLHIIPSKELRLIPLYTIITHIYEKIIEATFDYEFTYAFNIDQLIKNHELNHAATYPLFLSDFITYLKTRKYTNFKNRIITIFACYFVCNEFFRKPDSKIKQRMLSVSIPKSN